MKTSGNTILVTGGTSGIGLEMVRQFYEAGNTIIAVSSNEMKLQSLAKQFPGITVITCNLAQSNSVQLLIDHCLQRYLSINVIINNAGVQNSFNFTVEKNGYNKIEAEIAINFTSPVKIMYGLLPLLVNKQEAALVNISSALALAPKKSAPVYCATKAAIHTITKALRYQLENTPVKVFELIPPLVATAMTEGRGKGRITPQQLVDAFMRNFTNNKFESYVGKANLLRIVHRVAPGIAYKIMKNSR